MNAVEARKISEQNAKRIAAENKAKADKAAITRKKNEEDARKKFYLDFVTYLQDRIDYAIIDGKTSAKVFVGNSTNNNVDAHKEFKEHPYQSEIIKAMKLFEDKGFKITTGIDVTEYETQHESSVPDYKYWEHYFFVQAAW
jgi:hypothetical protein